MKSDVSTRFGASSVRLAIPGERKEWVRRQGKHFVAALALNHGRLPGSGSALFLGEFFSPRALLFGVDYPRGGNIVGRVNSGFTANPVRLTDMDVSGFILPLASPSNLGLLKSQTLC
jgi:hypothetical protein